MAATRLGYVKGADYSEGLAGIAAIGKDWREGAKKKKSGDLMERVMSGDQEALQELSAHDPDSYTKVKQGLDIQNTMKKDNLKAMWMGATQAMQITDPDPTIQDEKRREFMRQRIAQGEKEGRDMSHSIDALEITDPKMLEENLQNTITLANGMGAGGDQEFYKMMMEENFKKDLALGNDWQKTQWSDAKAAVDWFDKRANALAGSYEKIKGLSKYMQPGTPLNRTAINGAIMSLARMISPGVVTETDARQLAGATDPMTYGLNMLADMATREGSNKAGLQNASASFNEMRRTWDAADPNTFDVPAFLNIAKAVAGSEIPGLMRYFEGAANKATRSGMRKDYQNTYFGDNEMVKLLKGITTPDGQGGGGTPPGGGTSARDDLANLPEPG